jgi:MFS family permease
LNTQKTYQCGTLTYTRPALVVLFFWLLWGDFCYVMMESVTGPIMQLKFESLGASNALIGVVLVTIPGIVFSVMNPIISFKSDRFRSRLGRRIPFVIVTLPFLTLALVGLAYCNQIGLWVHGWVKGSGVSANAVVIGTIAVILVTFTFFNTAFTSMFWFLFRDVVPEHLLARFMSWFRLLALGSTALYQNFIFPYSATHSTQIFLGAAALYLVGFGLMVINVREGQYPPPPPYVGGQTGPLAAVKTYARECHSHAHYWYFWLMTFIGSIGGGVGIFALFFTQRIGLDLNQIGRINMISSIVTGILVIGVGWLADRFHPIRVVIAASLLGLVVTPVNLIWLFWHPPADALWQWHFHLAHWQTVFEVRQVYLVQFCIAIGLASPVAALSTVWDPVLLMRLFPHERLGQFCSTNSVWRNIGGVIGAVLAGASLDFVGRWVGKDQAYFYIPVWQFAFSLPTFYLLLKMYGSWKRYGGDAAYVPPSLEPAAPVAGLQVFPAVPGFEPAAEPEAIASTTEDL